MVDHFSTYIYQKRGLFYFSKRIPKQVQQSYGKQRIVFALNTRSRASAIKYAQVIQQAAKDEGAVWQSTVWSRLQADAW